MIIATIKSSVLAAMIKGSSREDMTLATNRDGINHTINGLILASNQEDMTRVSNQDTTMCSDTILDGIKHTISVFNQVAIRDFNRDTMIGFNLTTTQGFNPATTQDFNQEDTTHDINRGGTNRMTRGISQVSIFGINHTIRNNIIRAEAAAFPAEAVDSIRAALDRDATTTILDNRFCSMRCFR